MASLCTQCGPSRGRTGGCIKETEFYTLALNSFSSLQLQEIAMALAETREHFPTTELCLGDAPVFDDTQPWIYQIDNPYLDSSSNGLSYLVERMKGQALSGHMTLARSERSGLASLAAEIL